MFGWFKRKEMIVPDDNNMTHYKIPLLIDRKIHWFDVYVLNEKYLGKCFKCYDRRADELYLGDILVCRGITSENIYDKLLEFRRNGYIVIASGAWKFNDGVAFGKLKWDGEKLLLLGMEVDEKDTHRYIDKSMMVFNAQYIINRIKDNIASYGYRHFIETSKDILIDNEMMRVVRYIFKLPDMSYDGGYKILGRAYTLSIKGIGDIGVAYNGKVTASPIYRDYLTDFLKVLKEIDDVYDWIVK